MRCTGGPCGRTARIVAGCRIKLGAAARLPRFARMATISGAVSHWFSRLPAARPALPGDQDADVTIVGPGYTGLWTAYYLQAGRSSLRIVIIRPRFARFRSLRAQRRLAVRAGARASQAAGQTYGRDKVVAWQRTSTPPSTGHRRRQPGEHRGRHRQGRQPRRRPQRRTEPAGCARRSTRTGNGEPTTSSCCRRPRRPNASRSIHLVLGSFNRTAPGCNRRSWPAGWPTWWSASA